MQTNLLRIDEIIDFKKPIIYLDIEANQVKNSRPRIVQIGAILVENGKIVNEFNQWSNPESKVSSMILDLVSRNQSFLNRQPKNSYVYKNFLQFVGNVEQIVVFGNYDQVVLDAQASFYDMKHLKLIDVQAKYFRKIIKSKQFNISLENAAAALDIKGYHVAAHHALLDSKVLFEVIEKIRKAYAPDLQKKFCFEMIMPKIKKFRNEKGFNAIKDFRKIKQDFSINYFLIKKTYEPHPENQGEDDKKYISKIECIWKNFAQNGVINLELKDEKQFDWNDNYHETREFIEKFNLQVLNKIDFNSIYFLTKDLQPFMECYAKQNQKHLLVFHYISMLILMLYLKNFEGIDQFKNFLSNERVFKKIFDLIKRKMDPKIFSGDF